MDQSVAPAPQSFLFAEFGDLAQQTLLDFGLHLDAVELFVRFQFFITSRGEEISGCDSRQGYSSLPTPRTA